MRKFVAACGWSPAASAVRPAGYGASRRSRRTGPCRSAPRRCRSACGFDPRTGGGFLRGSQTNRPRSPVGLHQLKGASPMPRP